MSTTPPNRDLTVFYLKEKVPELTCYCRSSSSVMGWLAKPHVPAHRVLPGWEPQHGALRVL